VYTTRIEKPHDELLISTLLLLLILPIYLGMYPSMQKYIDSYMSKMSLLLKTDDETNGLCLQWVPYIAGTMTQDVSVPRQTGGRSYCMPIQDNTKYKQNQLYKLSLWLHETSTLKE